jgi:hypothetical protein
LPWGLTAIALSKAGDLQYAGGLLYFNAADANRGVFPAYQLARTDVALALVGDTSTQPLFPAANDALTVIAGGTYRFRSAVRLTTGATSVTVSFVLGGTATLTTINYVSHGTNAATGTAAASVMNNGEAATAIVVVAAGTGVNKRFTLEGDLEVNAAGTIIPSIAFSADPQGDETVNVGSFFECFYLGQNPVTAIGPWA